MPKRKRDRDSDSDSDSDRHSDKRMEGEANTQQTAKPKLQWLPQTTPTPIQIPWSELNTIKLGSFLKQTDRQEQQMKEIVYQEENARKQKIIKPLLVKYLNDNGYLNKERYIILPYVMGMGDVFGNLPDGYNSNMLYLVGDKLREKRPKPKYNNCTIPETYWEKILLEISVEQLTHQDQDQIMRVYYNFNKNIKEKVEELQMSFNTVNKLDFSKVNGGKNNKKQQRKSIRTRASTKSHKHYKKSFTLKNVK